jgi:hypothetical protein
MLGDEELHSAESDVSLGSGHLYRSAIVITCYYNGHRQPDPLSLEPNNLPALTEILMACGREIWAERGSSGHFLCYYKSSGTTGDVLLQIQRQELYFPSDV